MAQYNISIDSEILHNLLLKGAKDEGIAKLLESILNKLLQAQATERMLLNQVLEEYRTKVPKAMDLSESGFEGAIAVLEFPER